ncbi:hypothetical protein Elgi_68870 [Paenibacillus elgii]|nr:hypothetical protein Elgi_68870 [Paenibacillus elgii]
MIKSYIKHFIPYLFFNLRQSQFLRREERQNHMFPELAVPPGIMPENTFFPLIGQMSVNTLFLNEDPLIGPDLGRTKRIG